MKTTKFLRLTMCVALIMGTTSPLSTAVAAKDSAGPQALPVESDAAHDAEIAVLHRDLELLKLERTVQLEVSPCRGIALEGEKDAKKRHLTAGWKSAAPGTRWAAAVRPR